MLGKALITIILNNFNNFKALLWQLMRAYILSLLSKLSDKGTAIDENAIIIWTNHKVRLEYIFANYLN